MGLFSRKKRDRGDDDAEPETDAELERDAELEAAGRALAMAAAGPDPRDEFASLVERELTRLASPGSWWTGAERLAVADDARRAQLGEPPTGLLPGPIEEAAERIAARPASIRAADVARWEAEGLNIFGYIEMVGVISRLSAIDTASFGLGQPAPELPDPIDGDPSQEIAEKAKLTTGWVPTVGPASAPSSLTALPDESDAMFDVHDVLYASIDDMFDLQFARNGLTRPQIELVAARTSHLNDCFY